MSQQKDTHVGQQVGRHTGSMMANGFLDNGMAHRLLNVSQWVQRTYFQKGIGDTLANVMVSGLAERLLTHWPMGTNMLANWFGRHCTKILTNERADRLPT